MSRGKVFWGWIVLFLLSGISSEKLFFIPDGWPVPVYDFQQNPPTQAKFELGRRLFYDPILSADSSTSCSSCHSNYNAFTHTDHALSHGIHDRVGKRNSTALFNLAWKDAFFWDGAVHQLDVQALAPLTDSNELGSKVDEVLQRLKTTAPYPAIFKKAFGREEINTKNFLKALAIFELSLISNQSKYDSVQRKEAQFTAQEKNGYILFLKYCQRCHEEPLFRKNGFEKNGLPMNPKLKDTGRFSLTKQPGDSLKFTIPSLRNLSYSYPYFHDGRTNRLMDVLQHYNATPSIVQNPMTKNELVDLQSFLLTLNDLSFVFNKQLGYPYEYNHSKKKSQ
jgi:cytochrome c peroxidase